MDTENIRIEFRAHLQLDLDLSLAIIGSGPVFGDWDIRRLIYAHLPIPETSDWTVQMFVKPRTSFFWSWVIVNGRGQLFRRESKPRRRLIELGVQHIVITSEFNGHMVVDQIDDSKKIDREYVDQERHCVEQQEVIETCNRVSSRMSKAKGDNLISDKTHSSFRDTPPIIKHEVSSVGTIVADENTKARVFDQPTITVTGKKDNSCKVSKDNRQGLRTFLKAGSAVILGIVAVSVIRSFVT